MQVAVIGSGYVGTCQAILLARHGHNVRLVDVVKEKVALINRGIASFHEPGVNASLLELVGARLITATTDLAGSVAESDMTFICVGTPSRKDGSIDLTFIRNAANGIGEALRERQGYHVVVVKSTVVPGTTKDVVAAELEAASGKRVGADIGVAMNPEFLKEGSALKDALNPDRIVVGAMDSRAGAKLWELYAKFDCPKITTDATSAEMIKYASNAFLATKIAFSNEVANMCERLGIDVYDVMRGVGYDARIGPLFLRAGSGFGGSCFPKDVSAIAALAKREGVPSVVLAAVLKQNDIQPRRVVAMLKEELGSLKGKRIALLGLAFKPDTDDVRETRALPIYAALKKAGAFVTVYDPQANANFAKYAGGRGAKVRIAADVRDCLTGKDGVIIQTEWEEFKRLTPADFTTLMKRAVVVDGRRTFDPVVFKGTGVTYRAIGLGKPKS